MLLVNAPVFCFLFTLSSPPDVKKADKKFAQMIAELRERIDIRPFNANQPVGFETHSSG